MPPPTYRSATRTFQRMPDSFGLESVEELNDAVEEQQPRQHSCDAERRGNRQHKCQSADKDEHERPDEGGRSQSRHGCAGRIHCLNPGRTPVAATLPSPALRPNRKRHDMYGGTRPENHWLIGASAAKPAVAAEIRA